MPRDLLSAAVVLGAFFLFAPAEHPVAAGEVTLPATKVTARLPGLQSSGATLLPNQWSLRPVGKQIEVGDFPVNIAVHPRAPYAAVMHSGYGTHEVIIIGLETNQIVSRTNLQFAFYGLAFDKDGTCLFACGGETGMVHQFRFAAGQLTDPRQIRVAASGQRACSAGLACSPDDKILFVAGCWGDALVCVPLAQPERPARLAMPQGSFPYAVLPARQSSRLFVSLWGKAGVAVVDLKPPRVTTVWSTAPHPTELTLSPDDKALYVACSDSNQVSVLDTSSGQTLEVINTALYPQAPNGSTPDSLALSPDGKTLLIANADNNNLAVVDVSRRGHSRSLGFIPVGWYPTSVRWDAAGKQIYVANGKGLISRANPHGPSPIEDKKIEREGKGQDHSQYIAGLLKGTVSVLPAPSPQDLVRYSKTAYQCSPLAADPGAIPRPRAPGHPIPARPGEASPIKHCIYIIKENRTYDQVFGDMREGNGDANLCIFPERVTPNHHALARQFVLLDNFYVDGEVSADGHEWSMAAYATDFVEKTWPLSYRPHGKLPYPSEGSLAIAVPVGGYLWDRCKETGVSYRSYGEFIENGPTPDAPGTARAKNLKGHFDPRYRSFDLDYPDARRADRFLQELRRFESAGQMPQLLIVRLPNDHTNGTAVGHPTPTAMVADNDLALGRMVEAISHSKFWPETAVFVLEDDAQNGSDHVDAHRSPALVISPFTKRHSIDSSMYSTSSMLRTMELILGLRPMSQYDAAARPMDAVFQAKADLAPFTHLPPGADPHERNTRLAWGAEKSAKMDFSKEDAADDLALNEIVWKSVRGGDSPMPPPVRAAFVLVREKDDDRD